MSYINIELLNSRSLSLLDIQIIQLAKQARIENVSDVLSQYLPIVEDLVDKGYLELIKGKKGENDFQRIRSTKLGNEVLDLISTPIVQDEHLKMRDYLIQIYLNHEDTERVVGNKKLIATYIGVLQNHLCITIYEFYYLCEYFLLEFKFTKKLENIFLDKSKNRYLKFKDCIEDSPLYQFYDTKKEEVERYWAQKIKQ